MKLIMWVLFLSLTSAHSFATTPDQNISNDSSDMAQDNVRIRYTDKGLALKKAKAQQKRAINSDQPATGVVRNDDFKMSLIKKSARKN